MNGVAVLTVALLVAACAEEAVTPNVQGPVNPPLAGLTDPLNGQSGSCMSADAYKSGFFNGQGGTDSLFLGDPTKNCEAEDVKVATATLLRYSTNGTDYITYNPGDLVTCQEGTTVFLDLTADIEETATSARSDIGIWIATDGGNARTGECNHYNLINGATGVSDTDQDSCGDMNAGAKSPGLTLGIITAVCQTASNSTVNLHVGSCIGWTQPGGDRVCPTDQSGSPDSYRFGTVPGTTSKCNCDGFDVPITVNRKAFLEVVKACTPSNDGGTFDLLIDGSNQYANDVSCGGSTGKQQLSAGTNLNPGAIHSFGEGDFTAANYSTTYSCVNRSGGADRGSGSSLGPNNITLQPNDDVVCTYTNVRKPSIKFEKIVTNNNGGTKDVDDFGIATSAGTLVWDAGTDLGGGSTKYTSNTFLLSGATTVTMTESNVAGYTEGTWSCTPATASKTAYNDGSVSVTAGQQVTCSITNDDEGSQLIFVKRVVNDNGGSKTVSDFGITSSAGTVTFPNPGTADGANTLKYTSTSIGVNAGKYTFSELDVTGYTEGTWSCSPVSASKSAYNDGEITVGLGQTVTCTITNDDQQGSITLNKTVVNDNGGTKTAADFPVTLDGNSAAWATKYPVDAGSHNFAEGNVAGYTEGTWSCSPATATGTAYDAGSVTVANGQDVVCQITNNDDPGRIKLVKNVTNDHGGTKTAADFAVTLDGNAAAWNTWYPVDAGSHNFAEADVAGYTEGTWSCSPATATGTAYDAGSVTVANGVDVTCTITNNDDPAKITLVKAVVNDHGGTKSVSDFALTLNGNAATSGTEYTVNAGTQNFSEPNTTGYAEGTWSCSPIAQTGSAYNAGSVTLKNGESTTCTIINNDEPATLIVTKIVKGAGGTFDFTSTGGLPSGGAFSIAVATDGTNSTTLNNLNAGAYTVTEVVPSGFTLTDLGCTTDVTPLDPAVTQTVSTTIANGATVTCTFINQKNTGGTTRTQGFWQTHSSLTKAVWFGGTAGGHTFSGVASNLICGPRTIDDLGELLGGFWSSISSTTTGGKRSSLDQARMQLMQQLLAAILNNAAFNSSPTSGITIDQAKAAYCTTSITNIKAAATAMGNFNQSGDNGVFTPGVSANGKLARSLANLTLWNVLP